MRDAGFGQSLIDRELGRHDGVVGRGEDGVDSVGDQGVDGKHDLVDGGAVIVLVGDLLLIEEGLRFGDGGGGGVLAHVVEQGHAVGIGVGGEDELHDGGRVEAVRGAGDVGARLVHALDKPGGDRIGDGGEDHGDAVILGGGLHAHGNRGRHADHQVDIVGDKVLNDLGHDIGVGVAVVIADLERHALLLADGGEPVLNILHNLVQGGVVDIVADADLEDGVVVRGVGGGAQAEDQGENGQDGKNLFHFDGSFINRMIYIDWKLNLTEGSMK